MKITPSDTPSTCNRKIAKIVIRRSQQKGEYGINLKRYSWIVVKNNKFIWFTKPDEENAQYDRENLVFSQNKLFAYSWNSESSLTGEMKFQANSVSNLHGTSNILNWDTGKESVLVCIIRRRISQKLQQIGSIGEKLRGKRFVTWPSHNK